MRERAGESTALPPPIGDAKEDPLMSGHKREPIRRGEGSTSSEAPPPKRLRAEPRRTRPFCELSPVWYKLAPLWCELSPLRCELALLWCELAPL
jgi:hypothetical protein